MNTDRNETMSHAPAQVSTDWIVDHVKSETAAEHLNNQRSSFSVGRFAVGLVIGAISAMANKSAFGDGGPSSSIGDNVAIFLAVGVPLLAFVGIILGVIMLLVAKRRAMLDVSSGMIVGVGLLSASYFFAHL